MSVLAAIRSIITYVVVVAFILLVGVPCILLGILMKDPKPL